MPFPILISASKLPNWYSKIKESSSKGKWQEVFSHYHQMKKSGVQLTDLSYFPLILKACTNLSFTLGNSFHASLIKQGFHSFTSIGNSLIDFYAKSGVLDSALAVFNTMDTVDSVSWNIMIYNQLDQGDFQAGLCLFLQARITGFEPNISTLVLVIQAFRNLKSVLDGLKIHCYIIQSGFWIVTSVQNSLLSMYADIRMELAQKIFDEMPDRDVISWCVMIGGYVQSEEAQVGWRLFREMVSDAEIEADGQTMVNAIKACISLGDLRAGRLVHGFVICGGLSYDLFVANSLVDMYSKCKDADSAFKAFTEMPRRNVVSWNSVLSGFVHNEKHSEALMLFRSMGEEGIMVDDVTLVNLLQVCKHYVDPFHCKLIHSLVIKQGHELNEIVTNALVDAYAKCDLINLAWKLFSQMKTRDTVTWSTMIAGFNHCGMPDAAIALFQEMNRAQQKFNAITILNLLEACSISAELKRSKWAHGIVIRRGLASEVAVGTAILDMYSKCGAIEASRKAFNQISQKNVVSWSAMIAANGVNGLAHDALSLHAEMRVHGLKPNAVTSLCVLSACSHGGLVEEGLAFVKELGRDHLGELRLEHLSCMVDLLGRAGKLDNAVELLEKVTGGLKPGASAWGALLSACRSYGNSKLGEGAVSRVLELEPSNSAGFMLASNMYAMGGSWADAARMRWLAKERGVGVLAGYSLVHVNNKTCRFVAGDKHQPLSDEICLVIEQLHMYMKLDKQ